jgi:hypothetical protein
MAAQTPGPKWWVDQEGLLGDAVDKISNPTAAQALDVTWHVVQDAAKPNATAHGPYPTQAAAQAEADTLNATAAPSVVTQGAEAAVSSSSPIGGLFQASIWLRVAEVTIGVILIGIGLNAMLKGKPLSVVTSAAGKAGKAAMLA